MKLVYLICVWYVIQSSMGSQRDALGVLKSEILNKTDLDIPPLPDEGGPIELDIDFSIITPVFLDASMVLTTHGRLVITWTDPRQRWNSSLYDGNEVVELPEDSIWRPQFVLSNSADDIKPLNNDFPLKLNSFGTFTWEYRNNFQTRCLLDLKKYPFDEQECLVEFLPVSGYKFNLSVSDPEVDTTFGGAEWKVKNLTLLLSSNDSTPGVRYLLKVKREYFYYLLNTIAPICLMTFLMPIVFLIPARSGEKLGYLMSVFLSFTVFLSIIQDSVPPSSGQLTSLSVYLVVVELQGFFTVLATIFVLAIHHRKEKAEEVESRKESMRSEEKRSPKDQKKCRSCVLRCWANFSCERFFDAVFFILSFMIASGSVLLFTRTEQYMSLFYS